MLILQIYADGKIIQQYNNLYRHPEYNTTCIEEEEEEER